MAYAKKGVPREKKRFFNFTPVNYYRNTDRKWSEMRRNTLQYGLRQDKTSLRVFNNGNKEITRIINFMEIQTVMTCNKTLKHGMGWHPINYDGRDLTDRLHQALLEGQVALGDGHLDLIHYREIPYIRRHRKANRG